MANARPSAVAIMQKERPPVVIMDLGLPPDPDGVSEGFATLEEVLHIAPETKVIVVTGNGERKNALKAVSSGAYDFCEKPVEIEVLRTIIERGLNLHRLEDENRRLAAMPARSPIERIITANEAMLKICRDVEKLAATHVPVLLLGESGTGKEALAQALHDLGPRAKQPFVAINCGAIPENLLECELFGYERGAFTGAVKQTIGKIESAHHGTLFLDEIGDLPHPLQVKLLRFLQDQIVERIGGRQRIQVDVRIVSATNSSLQERVDEGSFRGDLFYRMNAVTVRIPPLRDRGGDALLLANYFLGRFNREFGRNLRGFTEAATAALSMPRLARQRARTGKPHETSGRDGGTADDRRAGSGTGTALRIRWCRSICGQRVSGPNARSCIWRWPAATAHFPWRPSCSASAGQRCTG